MKLKGIQNKSPQNMLLWHEDCFELKAIKIHPIQEKLFTSPLAAYIWHGKGGMDLQELLPEISFYLRVLSA